MFNIDPSPTFTADVPLSRPGLSEPLNVQVTFRYKNRLEMAAWVATRKDAKDLVQEHQDDVEMLGNVMVGWSGLIDDKGEEVPYSATNLSKLLVNFTPARGELFRAYVHELTDAKRKN